MSGKLIVAADIEPKTEKKKIKGWMIVMNGFLFVVVCIVIGAIGILVFGVNIKALLNRAQSQEDVDPLEDGPMAPAELLQYKDIQIGLVTDDGRVDDQHWNQAAWEGLQKATDDYDLI